MFLMQSQCCCRKSAAAEVQLRIDALQLLAPFLSLPGQQLSRLSEAVNELVTDVFPASSWEWKRGSTQSTDYARQLMALMDSVVAAAEMGCAVQAMLQVKTRIFASESQSTRLHRCVRECILIHVRGLQAERGCSCVEQAAETE